MAAEKTTYHIPSDVLFNKKLIPNAKLLYSVIEFICKRDDYCIKQNKELGNLFGVSPTSISLWVKSLQTERFVTCRIYRKYYRVIFLYGTHKEIIKGVLRNLKDNTTYYKREHFEDAHAVDDFSIETKIWTDKEGVKRGRDSIDYEEEE
jgi:hypothetical protein